MNRLKAVTGSVSRIIHHIRKTSSAFSIRKKLVLLYVFFIFLPACILVYYFYLRSSSIIEKEVTKTIFQALKQAELNISYQLENVKDISNIIFGDPSLSDYLRSKDDGKTAYDHIQEVKPISTLMDGAEYQGNFFKLRLFTSGKMILPSEREQFGELEELKKKSWYADIVKMDGKIYWKSTHPETDSNGKTTQVISAARIIRNPENWGEITGVLMVDIPESSISDIISLIELAKNQSIYIIDSDGRIISGDEESLVGSSIAENPDRAFLIGASEGVYTAGSRKDSAYIISKRITLTGWTIVSEIPAAELKHNNSIIDSVSGAIFIIITLVFFMSAVVLLFSFIADGFINRLRDISLRIESSGIEAYSRKQNEEADVSRLEKSVDTMISTVKKLTEESYQAKLKERDAQLTALQAQINPHFLYNTLDVINWMAIRKNASDISFMLSSLARYFRLSLNKGKDIVSVEDEINLAKVYLEIQKVRFGGGIEAEFQVEPEVKDCLIPKLTLQPIIENALLHGIMKRTDKKGYIRVGAYGAGNLLILVVEDNGVGMSRERIDEIFRPDRYEAGPGGYGIYNVNERIRIFSDQDGVIQITSTPKSGTRVEMRIALRYPGKNSK